MSGDRNSGATAPPRSDVDRRAALHGALADPTRLRVVDHLALSDASSSELGAGLDVPSNLLAHHLGALESAGVIAQRRSEGDGRRRYWRLVAGSLDTLAPRPHLAPRRIVFVCTANSARSHLAAALWAQRSPVPATSAGTSPADRIAPGAVDAARRHDILLLPDAAPRSLDEVGRADDLVITVCDLAHEHPGVLATVHWSIPDPVRIGTEAAFDHAIDLLGERVDTLAPHLDTAS